MFGDFLDIETSLDTQHVVCMTQVIECINRLIFFNVLIILFEQFTYQISYVFLLSTDPIL